MALPNLAALRMEPDRQPRTEQAKTEVFEAFLDALWNRMGLQNTTPAVPAAGPGDIVVVEFVSNRNRVRSDGNQISSSGSDSNQGLELWKNGAVMWSADDGSVKGLVNESRAHAWIQSHFTYLRQAIDTFFDKSKKHDDNRKPRPDRSPVRNTNGPDHEYSDFGTTLGMPMGMKLLEQGGHNVFFAIDPSHPTANKTLRPWLTFIQSPTNPKPSDEYVLPQTLGVRISMPQNWTGDNLEVENGYYEAMLTMHAGSKNYGPRVYAAQLGPKGMLMITEKFQMDLSDFLGRRLAMPLVVNVQQEVEKKNLILNVMQEVANVVELASQDGMLLCDIKTSNIVLTLVSDHAKAAADVRLIDFAPDLTGLFRSNNRVLHQCITLMNALFLMHTINCWTNFHDREYEKCVLGPLAKIMNAAYVETSSGTRHHNANTSLCTQFLSMTYTDTLHPDDRYPLAIEPLSMTFEPKSDLNDEFLRAARRAINNILHYARYENRYLPCIDGIDVWEPIVPQLIAKFAPFGKGDNMPR